MDIAIKKTCFKCNVSQSLENFYAHPQMSDGHVNKCKECNKKGVKENFYRNRKHYDQYEANREGTPKRKEQKLQTQRNQRAKNPHKSKARRLVFLAIKSGKITKQPCQICADVNVEAHHDDHHRPLDIMWLCFKHHRQRHGQMLNI